MSAAVASLIALVVAIVLSMTSRVNVGLLSIAFTWLIGVYIAGLKPDAIMAGFPVSLFLTLVGVTLLFAAAEANGTLELLANRAVGMARGNARLLPLLFFLIATVLSSIGPGAISSVALLIPLAMKIGDRAGIPQLLTALMIGNGANAGNLSPVSTVGIIANSGMAKAGLVGYEGKVWFTNFIAHLAVATAAYFIFGGLRLVGTGGADPDPDSSSGPVGAALVEPARLARQQRLTMITLVLWIAGVIVFRVSVGLSAFAAASLLTITSASDESAAIRKVPWGIIMMVSGVALLISLLEKTGGMDLFTTLLARTASPASVNGVIALVTGAISTYSSTSGVVLPAFLPTASGLVEKLGGGDPLAVALSINVGSSLVDVSPLSTLGALCVAAVASQTESRLLFRRLLAWGLSMAVVGAIFSQLFAGIIART